jgi:hypothetical protein
MYNNYNTSPLALCYRMSTNRPRAMACREHLLQPKPTQASNSSPFMKKHRRGNGGLGMACARGREEVVVIYIEVIDEERGAVTLAFWRENYWN